MIPSISSEHRVAGSGAGERKLTPLMREREEQTQPPTTGGWSESKARARSSRSSGDGSNGGNHRLDLCDYLYSSGTLAILDALSAALLREKPAEPVSFILSWLRAERERAVVQSENNKKKNDDSGSDGDGYASYMESLNCSSDSDATISFSDTNSSL